MIEGKSQLFLLGKIFKEVNKEELVGWRNNYKPIHAQTDPICLATEYTISWCSA